MDRNNISYFSRTLLVQQTVGLLLSVASSLGPSLTNLNFKVHFGEPFDTEIFELESRLTADKGTEILTPAVELECCVIGVVYILWSPEAKVNISGGN